MGYHPGPTPFARLLQTMHAGALPAGGVYTQGAAT